MKDERTHEERREAWARMIERESQAIRRRIAREKRRRALEDRQARLDKILRKFDQRG